MFTRKKEYYSITLDQFWLAVSLALSKHLQTLPQYFSIFPESSNAFA